jgi:hypothetical protein
MNSKKKALVITTIASSKNLILRKYAKISLKNNIDFIVIGDKKSPSKFLLKGANYFSLQKQKTLNFKLSKILPINHYSRKNLGYLMAMQNNPPRIIETDDDNIPLKNFFSKKKITKQDTYVSENAGWVNVYKFFTKQHIWPRGFALEKINTPLTKKLKISKITYPIQQGLADENPDVDAIYRLTGSLPIKFNSTKNIALGKGSVCPFNSQNTEWHKQAYPLMYLPSYCSFRMTDIWRSFIAQRVAWTCDWGILFHNSTVIQKRNVHNLMHDFEDEISGYRNNYNIMKNLIKLKLKPGIKNIQYNMILCYKELVLMNLINKKEIRLLNAWFLDLKNIQMKLKKY